MSVSSVQQLSNVPFVTDKATNVEQRPFLSNILDLCSYTPPVQRSVKHQRAQSFLNAPTSPSQVPISTAQAQNNFEKRNREEHILKSMRALDDHALHAKLLTRNLEVSTDRDTNIFTLLRSIGYKHSFDPVKE